MKPVWFIDLGWLGVLLMFWRPLLVLALVLYALVLLSLPVVSQMATESVARAATPAPMPIAPVWQTALALGSTPVPVP